MLKYSFYNSLEAKMSILSILSFNDSRNFNKILRNVTFSWQLWIHLAITWLKSFDQIQNFNLIKKIITIMISVVRSITYFLYFSNISCLPRKKKEITSCNSYNSLKIKMSILLFSFNGSLSRLWILAKYALYPYVNPWTVMREG